MNVLFSEFLTFEQLQQVNYYTYFPVMETEINGDHMCQLLPSDHAIYYPLDFSVNSRTVLKGELNFFNKVLLENLQPGNYLPDAKVRWHQMNRQRKKQCLIINLLDNCFGHSFMKMLNIRDIYEEHKDKYDFCIVVPRSLEHFLPAGIFTVISIDISFSESEEAYSLKRIIDQLKAQYEAIDFSVLDTYKEYTSKKELKDFFRLTDMEKAPVLSHKIITFYYRADFYRTWGGRHQAKNIITFFKIVKEYFSDQVLLYVVGDKDNYVFPEWIYDRRADKFSAQVDYEYNAIFSNSLMTVGIMGSNMLAPSLFSDMSVHLIPEHKLANTAEEVINSNAYAIPACFENIYIYGDGLMNEYTPEMLASRLIVLYYTRLTKEYKHACIGLLKNQGEVLSQKEYLVKFYPYINYNKAVMLKSDIQNNAYHKIRKQYIVKRILAFIPAGFSGSKKRK